MGWKSKILLGLFAAFLAAWIYFFFTFNQTSNYVFAAASVVAVYILLFYILVDRSVKDPEPVPPAEFPSLSILIPCYNAQSTLESCLAAAFSLEYPRAVEIIAVNDASRDSTGKILEEHAKRDSRLRVLTNPVNRGKAASLNRAIREAKGEILACMDADTYPGPDALVRGVPYFYLDEKMAAVIYFVTAAHSGNWIQVMQEIEYFNGFGFIPKTVSKLDGLIVIPGPLSLFRRKYLVEVGGFDEDNMTEDMEIGLRLQDSGLKIAYCRGTEVPTEVPHTLGGFFRQRLRWYRGTLFNLRKYKHMMLDKGFRHLGLFSLPVVAYYVIVTLFTFTVLAGFWLRQLFNNLYLNSVFLQTGTPPRLVLDESTFILSSGTIFMVLFVAVWFFYYFRSLQLIGRKTQARYLLHFPIIFFVYPLLISFFYVMAAIHELAERDVRW